MNRAQRPEFSGPEPQPSRTRVRWNDVLGLVPIDNAQFQYDTAPATTLNSYVKTTRTLESHVIRIHTGINEFVRSEDHARSRVQGVDADLFRTPLGEEVARAVKIEFVAHVMLAVTAVRIHHLHDDGLAHESGHLF